MMGIFFAACLVWWSVAVPRCDMRQDVLGFQVYLASATLLPLMVVWGSTLNTNRGIGLPAAAVVFFSVLFAMVASSEPSKLFEFVVVAGLLLFWHSGGFTVFRSVFGIVSHADLPITSNRQLIFTIRQLVAVTAGFAVIFACLRFTGLNSAEYLGTIAWLCSATLVNSTVALFAVGCVFYFRITLFAFLVWLFMSGFAVATHYILAVQVGLDINDLDRMRWYPMTTLSGLLVFLLCRYVRGHSYELRHSQRDNKMRRTKFARPEVDHGP